MFRSGLLILTSPVTRLAASVPKILASAADHVNDILYIHLAPDLAGKDIVPPQISYIPSTSAVKQLVTNLYSRAASHHQKLDVRVIVGNIGDAPNRPRPVITKYNVKHPFEILLSNSESSVLVDYAQKYFTAVSDDIVHKVISVTEVDDIEDEKVEVFDNICLGGTFDRLHTGHKILLNEALVICNNRLVVGVTDGNMNSKKTIPELIEPCDHRISTVLEFLEDVKPQLLYHVVPILDPYGPSITEADLQCIVVSEETARGGQAVNNKRIEKGMSELAMVTIPLIQEEHREEGEEEKISSSSQRRRLLGTLRKPPQKTPDSRPYILGLTGGIASGKSSVCKRLEGLGAAVIDCDKLGHKAYEKDGAAYSKMVETFGSDIVAEDGSINRRALGPKVFADPKLMQKLNEIVWPVIADLARAQMQEYHDKGHSVIILDAAVLLEAGWDEMVHEVWTTVIPKQEAVSRIMERNKLSEEEALRRISSQMSNDERVSRANVVICTLWEYHISQAQVERAWGLLQERISPEKSSHNKLSKV